MLDYLYNLMPSEDELTYTQGLNAALLAGTFADWLSMSEEEKNTLILCRFYYDIGKLQLPYELLWKPGKLTEEEFKIIKTHPVVGYTSVRNQDLNEHVKNAVIMHDVELLMPIMKRIADAQIGTNVQLNDGSFWEVLIIHPNKFSRPILKNEFVYLLQRTDLEIVKNV